MQTEVCWDGIQKTNTATQEPIFLKSFVDAATQTEVATILMKKYAATQEPTFSITFAEAATQIEIVAALMEKDVVTQEPTSPKLITEEAIEVKTATTLSKDEPVTLPIQSEKDETSGDKVGMQIPQEIVLDFNDEKNAELSLLKVEVKKWKYHVDPCQEGMVPLVEHKKNIKELREKWEEELNFQRFRWEEVQKELKELKKFKSMQKDKEKLYALF